MIRPQISDQLIMRSQLTDNLDYHRMLQEFSLKDTEIKVIDPAL